jgi:hypothetical protein
MRRSGGTGIFFVGIGHFRRSQRDKSDSYENFE